MVFFVFFFQNKNLIFFINESPIYIQIKLGFEFHTLFLITAFNVLIPATFFEILQLFYKDLKYEYFGLILLI